MRISRYCTLANLASLHFNAICISETSQPNESDFVRNVNINNYCKLYTTETLTGKGGVAIYIKDNLETIERNDLKIKDVEYETVWVEIKNKREKNILIGCIYRHPHMNNMDDFINYMEKTLSKINKENKEVYITGDFNIDLLKYEMVPKYQDFYNMMASNGYLPQITMPTRLTDTTMSIIDNIYTNTFTEDIFSGNIILQVADHLLQFISVNKKHTVNHIKSNYYKRDFKMFNEQDFLNDLSANNWDNNITDTNAKYNIFIWDLEHYANKHAPLKKVNKRKQK